MVKRLYSSLDSEPRMDTDPHGFSTPAILHPCRSVSIRGSKTKSSNIAVGVALPSVGLRPVFGHLRGQTALSSLSIRQRFELCRYQWSPTAVLFRPKVSSSSWGPPGEVRTVFETFGRCSGAVGDRPTTARQRPHVRDDQRPDYPDTSGYSGRH